MTKVERAIREELVKQDWEIRQKVVRDMTEAWDEERMEGSFPQFIVERFVDYWMARVIRN